MAFQDDAQDFLFGTKVEALFNAQSPLNKWAGGTVVSPPKKQQRREFKSQGVGEPLWWVNDAPRTVPPGYDTSMLRPVEQLTIDVQAWQPSGDDSGIRRIYLSGKQDVEAVRAAVTAAGARTIQQGGQLYMARTKAGVQGVSSPEYEARYKAPDDSAGFLGTDQPQQPVQQQPPAAPVQQQAPAMPDPVQHFDPYRQTTPLPGDPEPPWAHMPQTPPPAPAAPAPSTEPVSTGLGGPFDQAVATARAAGLPMEPVRPDAIPEATWAQLSPEGRMAVAASLSHG